MSTSTWFSSLQHRLKSSTLRRAYWAVANRETLVSCQQEENFYRNLLVGLRREDLIFDLGANEGAKTDVFLRLGARVVAVEPDDACQHILQDRFLRYRRKPRPVTLVAKAVSDKVGIAKMWIDGPGSAVNTFSNKWADYLKESRENFPYGNYGLEFSSTKAVATTTIEDLVAQHGVPFFIKIDVEGHELNVLRGMRQAVQFLSFEVNLNALRKEGVECVRVLSQLAPDGQFNYTPDCCSGLVFEKWLGSEEFCDVLDSSKEETVEVFWKSNCNSGHPSVRD